MGPSGREREGRGGEILKESEEKDEGKAGAPNSVHALVVLCMSLIALL